MPYDESLQWTDTLAIAQALMDAHPDTQPQSLRFTDLHRMVCQLDQFKDDPKRSNEKILESIQMHWLAELT